MDPEGLVYAIGVFIHKFRMAPSRKSLVFRYCVRAPVDVASPAAGDTASDRTAFSPPDTYRADRAGFPWDPLLESLDPGTFRTSGKYVAHRKLQESSKDSVTIR
jgi:hypothetical protein